MRSIPTILIAGTSSNVGKTSITLGLARLLKQAGKRVRCFKVGPDFLDPTWLTLASGNTCYNLDGCMCGEDYVRQLFQEKTVGYDFAIIEGVMGMFDGASPDSIEGSSAQMAVWLGAPTLLVVDASGMAGSIAPIVKGFADFHPDVTVSGVIGNRCGSEGHAGLLAEALAAANLPPLVGWVQKDRLPALSGRHLGLHAASAEQNSDQLIDKLAERLQDSIDISRLPSAHIQCPTPTGSTSTSPICRIGIARDEAFHFYYPDNLEMLQAAGAELVDFSPLHDKALPDDLQGMIIGGGYPELFAAALADNTDMLGSIRAFASAHHIYAECGGLMYLSQAITTTDGSCHDMAGLLPFQTRMLERLRMLGYTQSRLNRDSVLGPSGAVIRGHEFHYSEIIGEPDCETIYTVTNRAGERPRPEGYKAGNVLASYVHQHFGSNSAVGQHMVEYLIPRGIWVQGAGQQT